MPLPSYHRKTAILFKTLCDIHTSFPISPKTKECHSGTATVNKPLKLLRAIINLQV